MVKGRQTLLAAMLLAAMLLAAMLLAAMLVAVIAAPTYVAADESASTQIAFPAQCPPQGNFNRPRAGEALDISPPGFCWWRAGPRERVKYRLNIRSEGGLIVHQSPLLADPVYVPSRVLDPGDYQWTVVAVVDGRVAATLGPRDFRILADPIPLPWIKPSELLRRVPAAHPRLLFPAAQLEEVRATLGTTRQKAFRELQAIADAALSLELMEKPTFDRFDRETEYAQRRVAYRQAYHKFTRVYHQGMLPLAATYVLTGDARYGQAAKAHLLNIVDWEIDGIASLESSFDEIGLRIQRTAAQGYDWLYDLLSPAERDAVQQMLLAHGDLMLSRLRERDFLNCSGYSHDGRLPGYLVEFAIALAEWPEAEAWMEYAMQALLTVFPHWAGSDGGWAEGINYSLSYNDRFITPLQSLHGATGFDLWQKPCFRKYRHFVMYNVSPRGELLPFGDGEQKTVASRGDELISLLQFHSLRYHDPVTRWWIDLIPRQDLQPDRLGVLHRLILPDTLPPQPPQDMPLDRAFHGVGWAALHTDLAHPEQDLMVLFKSSPFGSVSHSHADQNSFVIMQGGRALAMPGGERFPQHGSPFHEQYTQHTLAHNALLIDGQGQRNRDSTAGGELVAFQTRPHLAYVAGDARKCYTDTLQKYVRHVLLIRPSLVVILDDIKATRPVDVTWLLHAKQKMDVHGPAECFTVHRGPTRMVVHLASPSPLTLEQTNAWPVPPKQGYPMVTLDDPPRQWHFQAKTTQPRASLRIAAIMMVGDRDHLPEYSVRVESDEELVIVANLADGRAITKIKLTEPESPTNPLLNVLFTSHNGEIEHLAVP